MTPRLVIACADHYEYPLPPGHPFPATKYRRVRQKLEADEATHVDVFVAAEPIDPEVLYYGHDEHYVERWLSGDLSRSEVVASGFPWSPELITRTRAAVGASLIAVRAAQQYGIGSALAGGTHHAGRARASGYCIFNDLACLSRLLLDEGSSRRILIVDLDVHQGDGTSEILRGEDRVFTFSMHGARNFPRIKIPSSLDLALPDGTGDDVYLGLLTRHLPEILDSFRPDFVFYQAGVDVLAEDHLGRLSMTHSGLEARDEFVFREARRRGLPIASLQGGGYAKNLDLTVTAHAGVVRTARRVLLEFGFH